VFQYGALGQGGLGSTVVGGGNFQRGRGDTGGVRGREGGMGGGGRGLIGHCSRIRHIRFILRLQSHGDLYSWVRTFEIWEWGELEEKEREATMKDVGLVGKREMGGILGRTGCPFNARAYGMRG